MCDPFFARKNGRTGPDRSRRQDRGPATGRIGFSTLREVFRAALAVDTGDPAPSTTMTPNALPRACYELQ